MNSVAFIIGQLVLGGAEKQLYLLAKGLVQQGWKVVIITLHAGHGDYWEGPIKELGIPLCEASTDSRLKAIAKIVSFLKKHPVDILHSWSGFTGLYALLVSRLTAIPVCIGSQRSIEQHLIRELGFPLYWLSYFGFKGITVNSRFGMMELEKRWPNTRICFTPNGIDLQPETAQPDASQKTFLRQRFGIPQNMRVVGAVGACIQAKRFDLLIESIGLLQQNGLDCGLVIIGDGPLKVPLQLKAQTILKDGTFFFTGEIPNAEKVMRVFDIFCLTSDFEGTPNVVMEALASGLPVLSTNVGDVSELIEDGVGGVILPSNQPEVIARNIQALFENPELQVKMAECGKEKIQRDYQPGVMVTSMINFYRSLA
jgi:glycosyltransferase involved in cell wall biosynthesis